MLTKKSLAAFIVSCGLCLSTLAGVHAWQGRAPALTGSDYAEIQRLSAQYGQAIDSCSGNGYDYADLYTPDGVFIDLWS